MSWFLYSGQLGRNRAYEGKSLVGGENGMLIFILDFGKEEVHFLFNKNRLFKSSAAAFDQVLFL